MKRVAKEHICTYAQPMDTDNNVVKARGDRGWGGGAMEDICNSFNN